MAAQKLAPVCEPMTKLLVFAMNGQSNKGLYGAPIVA
jgi:hypothetical protein